MVIKSDSQLAVNICNSDSPWRGHHQGLIRHIKMLIFQTNSSLCYIGRGDNFVADWIAKYGLAQPFGLHDFVMFPNVLLKLLYLDKIQSCNHGVPPPQERVINNS